MGTKTVLRWIPTDAYVKFSHDMSFDCEDSDEDDLYSESRSIATEEEPQEPQRRRLEERLRDIVLERANDYLDGFSVDDMDTWSIKIQWLQKRVEICEWCGSATCNGDPSECDEAPAYCDGCEQYTDHECDCSFCERCDTWYLDGCEEHNSDEHIEEIVVLLKSIGFQNVKVEDESGKEEETVL